MITKKALIKALRCSATPWPKGHTCEGCPYRLLEEVPDNVDISVHKVIDGKPYWESCDIEKMAMDAAYMLEKDLEQVEE